MQRTSDLENDKAVTFVAPSDYLRISWILEHSSTALDIPLQASPDSLTYKVCGPGHGERHLLVTVGRELTKSLELVALATPTPRPPSMLSS